jgi:hypothetical protein
MPRPEQTPPPDDQTPPWQAKPAPHRPPHPALDQVDNGEGGDGPMVPLLRQWGPVYAESAKGSRELVAELGLHLQDAAAKLGDLPATDPKTPTAVRDLAVALRGHFEEHDNGMDHLPGGKLTPEPLPRPHLDNLGNAPQGIVAAGLAILQRLHNVLQDRRTACANDDRINSMARAALVVADELDAWASDLENAWPNNESPDRIAGKLRAAVCEPV